MAVAVAPRKSLQVGLAASIAAHLLIVAYLAVRFGHPQSLAPPVDLANAIAISMEPFQPKPPPEPPQPKPRPQTPKDVVSTTAPDTDTSVSEEPSEPAEPAPSEPSDAQAAAASYASIVAGILQRNKKYPREALEKEIEGTVQAWFVINRQGHVIAYRIDQSSGQRLLDQEVVRLLRFVSFPPIPDDGGDPERREFALPIAFRIAKE